VEDPLHHVCPHHIGREGFICALDPTTSACGAFASRSARTSTSGPTSARCTSTPASSPRCARPTTPSWTGWSSENSEGEYAGFGGRNLAGRGPGNEVALQTALFTEKGCERIIRFGTATTDRVVAAVIENLAL
jgi:hypothetical protein